MRRERRKKRRNPHFTFLDCMSIYQIRCTSKRRRIECHHSHLVSPHDWMHAPRALSLCLSPSWVRSYCCSRRRTWWRWGGGGGGNSESWWKERFRWPNPKITRVISDVFFTALLASWSHVMWVKGNGSHVSRILPTYLHVEEETRRGPSSIVAFPPCMLHYMPTASFLGRINLRSCNGRVTACDCMWCVHPTNPWMLLMDDRWH